MSRHSWGVIVMSPNKGKDWGVSAGLYPNSPLMSSVILDSKSINPLEASFLPSVNGDNNNSIL